MPWCGRCARFLSPSTVRPDGTCPACGRAVDPGRARPPTPPGAEPGRAGVPVAPRVDPADGDHAHRRPPDSAEHAVPEPAGPDRGGGRRGRSRGADPVPPASGADGDDEAEELPPIPWHLKALGAGLVVYLGYRFMQGMEWVWGRFG